jgi:ribosome-associated translation inhibitor RaiA
MQILVNSDHHIHGGESANETVEAIVEAAVDHFADRITRIEVHLSDTNGPKHGERSKRCVMEARVAGLRPLATSDEAPNLLSAVEGAANKLKRALEHALARRDHLPGPTPREDDIASVEELDALEAKDRRK